MSLKGRVFYVCFPLILVVLTQMIHNIFMIFLGKENTDETTYDSQ